MALKMHILCQHLWSNSDVSSYWENPVASKIIHRVMRVLDYPGRKADSGMKAALIPQYLQYWQYGKWVKGRTGLPWHRELGLRQKWQSGGNLRKQMLFQYGECILRCYHTTKKHNILPRKHANLTPGNR